MYIMAFLGFTFGPLHIIFGHYLSLEDILDIFGATILIYFAKYNGAYRIMRKLAEWQIKQRDNKFDWKHR